MANHHDHAGDESDHRNAPSDHPQVAALGDLNDYEVAEGYPDVRGWTVKLADGRSAGKVHELIVDTGSMRTRYLDVRLDGDLAGAAGERDVLVPIGTARLDGRDDNVLIDNVTADQLGAMPAYEHGSLTRDHELAVRRHFDATTGSAAATSASDMGTASTDFYAHQQFDDSRFYSDRMLSGDPQGASSGSSSGSSAGTSRTDGEVGIPTTSEGAISRRAAGGTPGSRPTDGSSRTSDDVRGGEAR